MTNDETAIQPFYVCVCLHIWRDQNNEDAPASLGTKAHTKIAGEPDVERVAAMADGAEVTRG